MMVIWLLIRKVNYVDVDKQTTESLCISLGVTLYRAYGAGVPLLLCAATESEGVSVSAQLVALWLREATPSKRITPKSLRKNVQIMAQAAERLAEIAGEDSDSEDLPNLPRGRQKGKRSGSVLVATDIIEKRIDWPHLYIKRKVAGKSKGVAFEDMRMEEFVYGLVLMLKLPAANSIGMLCWMFWRWL